jgi:hypothetical protein
MIASVILAILALAGSAFVYRSRADIALQKNRRVAIELANSRLEKLMYNWSLVDVADLDGSPVDEDLSINGRSGYHRVTTVQVTGSDHDECLRISVSMQYNIRNGTDVVRFETLRGR